MPSPLEQIRDQQRETWDRFSHGWKKWDHHVLNWLAPVGEQLIRSAALKDTDHVLDVAAGTGEPGLTAALRVPKGTVTATDLSDRMLEVAAENAGRRGIGNFLTRRCDAGAMPFADDSFDAVLCRFGFMFFPDVEAGLDECVRVAKRGGRVCAAVWGPPEKNPWATTVMGSIGRYVDMPAPPPGAPGLFRCAAPGAMETAFRKAGLRDVALHEIGGELGFRTPDEYWTFMTEIAAPVVAGLGKADEPTRAKIKEAVLDLAHQASRNGQPRLPWLALTISGVKAR